MKQFRRALFVLVASAILGFGAIAAPALAAPLKATPTSTDPLRVLVKFKGAATAQTFAAAAHSAETSAGTLHEFVRGCYSWKVPTGRSAASFAAQLQASGRVVYAVPDYDRALMDVYTPPAYVTPNDPDYLASGTGASYLRNKSGKWVLVSKYPYAQSWWLRDIKAPAAWAQAYTGPNIVGRYPLRASGTDFTVVVIDSGLYLNHPDVGVTVVGGHDFFQGQTPDGTRIEDDDVTPISSSYVNSKSSATRILSVSHGTCVSGEIGATVHNGIGTVGVGYDTRVVVHKVMGVSAKTGHATMPDDAIIEAIEYSADHGAKVISMSFGSGDYSPAMADAINYAYSKGCVLVASKGNDGTSKAHYPANDDHVIGVGALDKNAKAHTVPASFSNYSKRPLDIMAPGAFIWGLADPAVKLDRKGYALWDGTSMAAPIVSGAVAWLWRAAPALSNAEITSEMLNSAPKGAKSKHYPSGYRKLDMAATYARLKAHYPLLAAPRLADQTIASLDKVRVFFPTPTAPLRQAQFSIAKDGETIPALTQDQWTDLAIGVGDHTVHVEAHSAYNWDDGTAVADATIHVVAAAEGSATLDAHVAETGSTLGTPAYHAAANIDATYRDAAGTPLSGGVVHLESSADGVDFAEVPGAVAVNVAPGVYRVAVAPESRTYYRLTSADAGELGKVKAATSNDIVVIPGVWLTTPSAKSSISHTKALSVSGRLAPAHATGSRAVSLKVKRWNGRRWVDYSAVWTRVAQRSSAYSTYAASLRLKKGSYRIYAYAPADDQHSATTSGYRTVKVN